MSSRSPSPELQSDLFLECLRAIDFEPMDDHFWSPLPDLHAATREALTEVAVSFSGESCNNEQPDKGSRKHGNGFGASSQASGDMPRGQGSARSPSSSSAEESRWAERLLNLCAVAIEERNVARIQHLLYVLRDLSSDTGDINHRLAAHGLRALTHELTGAPTPLFCSTFASIDPQFFRRVLVMFHELSPWFTFTYALANAALLETLSSTATAGGTTIAVHLVDIGISHGVQWPTFVEALARHCAGPPSVVRLTVVVDVVGAPFAAGPLDDDFPVRLERFAKSVNVNLEVKIVRQESGTLTSGDLDVRDGERLVICTQFRLHHLGEGKEIERKKFLGLLRNLSPEILVLSDNDADHQSGSFAERFARRVEFLRWFLESTAVGFKGRECEERRVVEGEAGMALLSSKERNQRKEEWRARMQEARFVTVVLSEGVLEEGRVLLKKHDANWQMKVEEAYALLCWKGQPVTFCSLWKPGPKE